MHVLLSNNESNDPKGISLLSGDAADTQYSDESDDAVVRSLFQIALGIGGTGIILRKHIVEVLGIDSDTGNLLTAPSGSISGSGKEAARMTTIGESDIVTLRIPSLHTLGIAFQYVRASVHTKGEPQDLELSRYASGLLCSDLIRNCCFVLDCGRSRISISPTDSWLENT